MTTVSASAQQMFIKPLVGGTLSTVTGDYTDDVKMKIGLAAGAEFGYHLMDQFAITAGALVSMQGAGQKDTDHFRDAKTTTTYLNIPILALSQLSRNSVQRQGSGGKPILSDLRESGSIEQDADMVIFIHRPDYLGLSDNPEDKEKTQIIIGKHRNGETKDIDMVFRSEQVRFMEPDDTLVGRASSIPSAMNPDFE